MRLELASRAVEPCHLRDLAEEEIVPDDRSNTGPERLRLFQPIGAVFFAQPRLRLVDAAARLELEAVPAVVGLQEATTEGLLRLRHLDKPILAPALRERALLPHHQCCSRHSA
eukprot:7391555-Prymnesium_polylepis.1